MLDDTIAVKQRHQRFLDRAFAAGEVWGLKSPVGWCISRSTKAATDGAEVMPFWSDRAYAQQCAREAWSEYEPTAIPLNEFLDRWLLGMAADNTLVGTNWNAHLIGFETTPQKLKEELEAGRTPTI